MFNKRIGILQLFTVWILYGSTITCLFLMCSIVYWPIKWNNIISLNYNRNFVLLVKFTTNKRPWNIQVAGNGGKQRILHLGNDNLRVFVSCTYLFSSFWKWQLFFVWFVVHFYTKYITTNFFVCSNKKETVICFC